MKLSSVHRIKSVAHDVICRSYVCVCVYLTQIRRKTPSLSHGWHPSAVPPEWLSNGCMAGRRAVTESTILIFCSCCCFHKRTCEQRKICVCQLIDDTRWMRLNLNSTTNKYNKIVYNMRPCAGRCECGTIKPADTHTHIARDWCVSGCAGRPGRRKRSAIWPETATASQRVRANGFQWQ